MIKIVLTLSTDSHDPKDTVETGEKFCEQMKEILLAATARNQVSSEVRYTVSEVSPKFQTVRVIVSRCHQGKVYDDRVFEQQYSDLAEAKSVGEEKKAPGLSVIVRPNYNEKDEAGKFYREWRSFNGEAFKEVRWNI